MTQAKFKRTRTIMISAYIIVAFVVAIVLSFLGIIHFFWLRDASREETTPPVQRSI